MCARLSRTDPHVSSCAVWFVAIPPVLHNPHSCAPAPEHKRVPSIQLPRWQCVCSVVSDSCVFVFSCVRPFVTPWTAARQAALSTWTLQARTLEWVASFSSRGSPDPGIGPESLASPELAGRFFTS